MGRRNPVVVGQVFHLWTVVRAGLRTLPTKTYPSGQWAALCRCSCLEGVERLVLESNLRSGQSKSCGCIKRKYVVSVGEIYGRLEVLELCRVGQERMVRVRCSCSSRTVKLLLLCSVATGRVQSCGCLGRELSSQRARGSEGIFHKHGMSNHRLYNTWIGIRERCYNPAVRSYISYGARGIKMYEEWRDDVAAFVLWMEQNLGPCPSGFSLDRIDNNRGYVPGNLRWATALDQRRNQRQRRTLTDDEAFVLDCMQSGLKVAVTLFDDR